MPEMPPSMESVPAPEKNKEAFVAEIQEQREAFEELKSSSGKWTGEASLRLSEASIEDQE